MHMWLALESESRMETIMIPENLLQLAFWAALIDIAICILAIAFTKQRDKKKMQKTPLYVTDASGSRIIYGYLLPDGKIEWVK